MQISNEDEETLKIIDKIDGSDRIIYYCVICIILLMLNGVLLKLIEHWAILTAQLVFPVIAESLCLW